VGPARGPGKSIDTTRYFVICSNILGGCRGSTGPNCTNPETGRRTGPTSLPSRWVTWSRCSDGSSTTWGFRRYEPQSGLAGRAPGHHLGRTPPERVRSCVAVATSARLTSQALAFDVVVAMRYSMTAATAADSTTNVRGTGRWPRPGPHAGAHHLPVARGHDGQVRSQPLAAKDIPTAFEKKFSVGSYLAYQGHKFVERFDANSYVTLSMAMDLFDLGDSPEQLRSVLARSQCQWLVLSFSSDWLFPPEQSQQIVRALVAANRPVTYCNVSASGGHDAFLLEEKLSTYGGLVAGFLAHVDDTAPRGRRRL